MLLQVFHQQYTNYIGNTWNKGLAVIDEPTPVQQGPVQAPLDAYQGPLDAYLHPRSPTLRQVFVQENHQLITEEVKKICESTRQSHKYVPAIFQGVVNDMMGELPKDEIARLQDKANSLLKGDRVWDPSDPQLSQYMPYALSTEYILTKL